MSGRVVLSGETLSFEGSVEGWDIYATGRILLGHVTPGGLFEPEDTSGLPASWLEEIGSFMTEGVRNDGIT